MNYDKNNLVNALVEVLNTTKENDNLSEEEQELRRKKAAYALNLCTVSVSQIIDYDDVAVMENEYEAILNNLNLQNMPKDQALLNILNHLLDTITFFRIQEKEKDLIEKRYRNQIKNAIWEAVPNLSILTDWKNPLNIATTVGLSYMNYRRKKAEYKLEKEFEDFQLERAAIDQFNNLQRELFDTSWRLADTYNFEDKYRLTERQIKQYNEILVDEDPIRRFERLESVKDNFLAYPPYWYYLGHTALEIVNEDKRVQKTISDKKKQEFISIAHKSFDRLLDDALYNILREDPIVSACALEYIDTLDAKNDKEKIEKLAKRAFEMAGNAYDIWQLCALAYLRIDKLEEACCLFRRLVNENYNAEVNAQILSSIYIKEYVQLGSSDILEDYNLLALRTRGYELFPKPEKCTDEAYNECERAFMKTKLCRLKERYGNVLLRYMNTCNLEFSRLYNKCVKRSSTEKAEIIEFFNKRVMMPIYALPGVVQNDILTLVSLKIKENKDKFIIEGKKDSDSGKNLFVEIMYPAFNQIGKTIEVYIGTAENLAEISELEDKMTKFCELTGVNESVILGTFEQDNFLDNLLDIEVFGELSERSKKQAEQDKKAKNIISSYTDKVLKKDSKNTRFYINDVDNSKYYEKYFNHEIFRHGVYQHIKQEAVAILVNENGGDDIIITSSGIRIRVSFMQLPSKQIRFDEIGWGKRGKDELLLGDVIKRKYSNNEVEMGILLELFQELKNVARDTYSESDARNPFHMLVKI